ncbi:50S ribosomal protein L29 [Eisenibacter elegans]|jgi:large subunit ribosomal protein L29|uniref:50S ribosomal protein L29 n=1 Tax=Eisenibacter elegans TaxID=997 RepID=UPI000411EC3E|nr:50S ribosomal protein L29 [Eisenibacter elegans]
MKNEEIKALSQEELESQLRSEKERLFKLKFAHAISPIENPMQIRHVRRDIARLAGELSARKKLANKQ